MRATAAKPAKITASELRADIYNILDQVIETGQAVEIERKGVTVKIVASKKKGQKAASKIERLQAMPKEDLWVGDPNDIFHIDWLEDWRKEWSAGE